MGNKITRVVVEGSQGDINSTVSPIYFWSYLCWQKNSVRIKMGVKYILIIFNILSHTLLSWILWEHSQQKTILSSGAGIILCGIFSSQYTWDTDYASLFWEVDAYLRLFMFKPIEFPGFLCKARFSRGGNSLFTSSGLHTRSQTILNKRKSWSAFYSL